MRGDYNAERAQATVETALVLPILMMILFAILFFMNVFISKISVINAAENGAMWWGENPGASSQAVKQQVIDSSGFQTITAGEINLSSQDSNGNPVTGNLQNGDVVTVTVKIPVDDVPVGSLLLSIVNGVIKSASYGNGIGGFAITTSSSFMVQ